MIDETKLIEDIRKCYSDYFNVHYSKGYKPNIENSDTSMPLKDVCRFIYLQPKIGEWISCKDRLPKEKGWYLLYAKGQRPFVGYFKGKTFPLNNHYHEIIAWCELPQPPREE